MTATLDVSLLGTTPTATAPVDPYADVAIGAIIDRPSDPQGWSGGCPGVLHPTDPESPGEYNFELYCTRSRHPEAWAHIATGGDTVLATWGVELPPEGEPDGPAAELEALPVGELVKFRNRRDALLVLGEMPDNKVEVLDLTHERYRVLGRHQLVRRPADAPEPTPTQMAWAAKFFTELRAKTREIGVRELRNRRWDVAVLNSVLRDLDLEPYVALRRGNAEVSFTFTVAEDEPGGSGDPFRQALQTKLREWIQSATLPGGVRIESTPIAYVGSVHRS